MTKKAKKIAENYIELVKKQKEKTTVNISKEYKKFLQICDIRLTTDEDIKHAVESYKELVKHHNETVNSKKSSEVSAHLDIIDEKQVEEVIETITRERVTWEQIEACNNFYLSTNNIFRYMDFEHVLEYELRDLIEEKQYAEVIKLMQRVLMLNAKYGHDKEAYYASDDYKDYLQSERYLEECFASGIEPEKPE